MLQGARRKLAGVCTAVFAVCLGASQIAAEFGRTRTISLHNIHTKETVTVLYKKDGKNIPAAMERINWVLRDWRRDEPTTMDPALIDLLWEIHTELGSKEPIHIISGYRSRTTNDMLRKTVGGQASESRHILGKAADVQFPDIPLKQLRYSAMIRERGGVGYYPTSATPFVHVDTDRVRAWPRLPRYELALLFPNAQTKHLPAEGEPITREDARIARERHASLATEIAAFHDFRRQPKTTTMLAASTPPGRASVATGGAVAGVAPAAKDEVLPWQTQTVASLGPPPRLVTEPRPAVRPPSIGAGLTSDDRARLDGLIERVSYEPPPRLVSQPAPARRPSGFATASLTDGGLPRPPSTNDRRALDRLAARVAALSPADSKSDLAGWSDGWVHAPAYDEEHPEELYYRPFPLAPLLTASASADDPALAHLEHPDASQTLALLADESALTEMRFTPGRQAAQLLWAQQFKGPAVNREKLGTPPAAPGNGLVDRKVRTSGR